MPRDSEVLDDWVNRKTERLIAFHDYAAAVWKRCELVAGRTLTLDRWERWRWVLECASKLHSVCSHDDLPTVATRTERDGFVRHWLGLSWEDADLVLLLCDNASWSMQARGTRDPRLRPPSWVDRLLCRRDAFREWRVLLDIVADSHMLEALGQSGVLRYRAHQEAVGPALTEAQVDRLVVRHCEDSLLRLYPRYFGTDWGRQEARPMHDDLARWVRDKKRELGG